MQQRFCKCGGAVMVEYKNGWKPRFWALASAHRNPIRYCPRCGRRLDIDGLH